MSGDVHTITIGGKAFGSAEYGLDYMTEFRRAMKEYVVPVSGNYLEWGAGHTTTEIALFAQQNGGKFFLTIDNNEKYLKDVLAPLKEFEFLAGAFLDINGPCINQEDRGLNYSSYPISLRKKFDFIFIDGRRRNECAMSAALMCHKDTTILVHDYRRARYQPMKAFFQVIEDGAQFRVMRPKMSIFNALNEVSPLIAEAML